MGRMAIDAGDPNQGPGWKNWFSTGGNLASIVGLILVVLPSFVHMPLVLAIFSYGFASACFVFWLVGLVFVSGGQRLTSLGRLTPKEPPARPQAKLSPGAVPMRARPPTPRRAPSVRSSAGVSETQAAPKVDTPPANIVFCRESSDNYLLNEIALDQSGTFRETDGPQSLWGVPVQFRNEPKPPQTSGRAADVRASILYYHDSDNPDIPNDRVDQVFWFGEASPSVSFDVGRSHHLILGFFERVGGTFGYNFSVFERSGKQGKLVFRTTGERLWMKIRVNLSWGEHHEFGGEHVFELVIQLAAEKSNKYYELFYLTGETDALGAPVKLSRGYADLI